MALLGEPFGHPHPQENMIMKKKKQLSSKNKLALFFSQCIGWSKVSHLTLCWSNLSSTNI